MSATKTAGGNVLLLAHFEGTLSAVETALRIRATEFQKFSQFDSAALCSPSSGEAVNVWAGLARSFPVTTSQLQDDWGAIRLQKGSDLLSSALLNIIVADHHPKRSSDEQLIAAAQTISCEAQLTFHISLDDPLLTHFGVRSIQKLYQRLGIDEENSLSNPMITAAIHRAQEKIESQVPKDMPAWSIEDWFRHNLPPITGV